MFTCISTWFSSVDKACGKPVDIVDNCGANRDVSPFFAVNFVDNPVDTVDEYHLWLCIKQNCEDAYEYPDTFPMAKNRMFPHCRTYAVCNQTVYTQEILQGMPGCTVA